MAGSYLGSFVLFNSYTFILFFLPATLAVFFLLGQRGLTRGAGLWLVLASLFFYGWWNPHYLLLIIISITANYWIGIGINHARHGRIGVSPKALLTLGVVLNLGALGYYKYANFFLTNTERLFGAHWQTPEILLPLAISFFTFTQIAYLVDAYQGVTEAYDFLYYALFVSFFPHLIAGPIVSYRRLMPQFAQAQTYQFQPENVAAGLSLFSMGLAKKVLIADNLAPLSQVLFDGASPSSSLIATWMGALAYTFQLYFDFSAYSDMAIGLARMFNVRFPLNFNSPYKARDISDFWRRWHMTLSHFLRDHLYIPLGGNRHGESRRYLNLMLTMLLGGLWHGAGWTFVLWGALHGGYLAVHHAWQRSVRNVAWAHGMPFKWAGWGMTFLAVVVGWVFFRSHSCTQACDILRGMAGLHGMGWSDMPHRRRPFLYLAVAAGIAFCLPNADEFFRLAERYTDQNGGRTERRLWQLSPAWAVGTALLLTTCLFNMSKLSEFLYFKF